MEEQIQQSAGQSTPPPVQPSQPQTSLTQTANSSSSLSPVKELFSQSWQVFTKSLLKLFLLNAISVATYALLFLLGVLLFLALGFTTNFFQALSQSGIAALAAIPAPSYIVGGVFLFLLFILALIIGSAIKIASIIVVANPGEEVSIISTLRRSLCLVIPLFLTTLLLNFFMIGGFFALVFPAILFYFFFIFVSYEVVLNHQKLLSAIRRSFLIVSRRFGEVLVRVLVFVFLYLFLVVFIPNLIRKIEPGTGMMLAFMSFLTNSLIGWYALAYYVTLYKQAKAGLEQEKEASLTWIWIISLLGWIILIISLFAGYKMFSSTLAKKFFEEIKTEEEVKKEKWGKAVEFIEKSLDEISPVTKIHWDRSQELFEQMRQNANNPEKVRQLNDENIKELKKALEIEPNNPRIWVELAHAYTWVSSEGSLEDSLAAYKKAEELDSNNIVYINFVGDMLIDLGRYEDAILQFQKTFRLTDRSGLANLSVGIAYKKLGIYDTAREHFQKAIEIFTAENKDGSYDDEILRARKEMSELLQ